jgi:replicative DNA helicase
VARQGTPALIFSLEMSNHEIGARLLSSVAGVSWPAMRDGTVDSVGWQQVMAAGERIQGMPLYIVDRPSTSVADIRAEARRLRSGRGLGLVIVDYLQLMSHQGAENRQQEIAAISRALKLLAKELGIPVIGVAQLNRAPEGRRGRRPILSDLRDSGQIEQDADVVLLMHREVVSSDPVKVADCEVVIAKHRNGPTGAIHLTYQGRYTRFVNAARGAKDADLQGDEQPLGSGTRNDQMVWTVEAVRVLPRGPHRV